MRTQRGWLLGEWLLSALLGLMALAAMLALLQDSLLLARSQRAQGPLQQAAAWLLRRLGEAAEQAGRGGVHPLGLDDARLAAWWPDNDHGPGQPASDALLVQHVAARDGLDCEGTRVTAGQRVVERYFLRSDSATSGWVLACDAGLCDAQGCTRLGDAGAALQSEVDSLQVLYLLAGSDFGAGFGTDAADSAGPWVDATQLRQMAAPRVLGIRMALLLHGAEVQSRSLRWVPPPEWFGPALTRGPDRLVHGVWLMTRELPHVLP